MVINKNVNNSFIYMNVNSAGKKRIRRTPEEAKALILEVAASRLAEMGLEGLNIAGVARAAGMSHATVIHHFGSTAAMREALLQKMTQELLADVMSALAHHESPARVLDRLFDMLSRDGHGRLLAWLALDQQTGGLDSGGDHTRDLFKTILDTLEAESGNRTEAKQQVFLVAVAAMGLGICGDSLANLIGMTDEEREQFPTWLAEHIRTL